MPRDAVTFGGLIGKLDMLGVECPKCGRAGRYSVRGLVLQHGRNGRLTDWLSKLTADCQRKRSSGLADPCGARMPDLLRLAGRNGQPNGPDAA